MYETTLSRLWHVWYTNKNPGTSSTIPSGNYNCDSYNIVYLLMCDKYDPWNYIRETSNKQRFTINNHKRASETTAGVSRCQFISTNPIIRIQMWDVLFSESTSQRRQTDSFVYKRSYSNSKHIRKVSIKIYHLHLRITNFTRADNFELLRLSTTSMFDVKQWVTLFSIHNYRHYTTEKGHRSVG